MTTLPLETFLDADHTTGEMKSQFFGPMLDVQAETPGGGPEQALTIDSGSITPADKASRSIILTGEGSADDVLDSIDLTNWPDGAIGILRGNGSEVITLTDADGGAGQMLLRNGVDYVLDVDDRRVALQRIGTSLLEIWRSHAKVFESTLITVPMTAGSEDVQAHGLGGVPDVVEFFLECVTAEHNWVVGDRIPINILKERDSRGFAYWDATNVRILNPTSLSRISAGSAINKTTFASATLTEANWKIGYRCWRV